MRSHFRNLAAAIIGGFFIATAAVAQTTPTRVPITGLPNARTPFDGTEQCLVVQTGNVLLAPCGSVGVTAAAAAPASPTYAAMWWDTSSAPATLKVFDGAQWIPIAKLNATGHVYAVDGVTLSGSLTLTGTISGGTINGATLTGITIDCAASTCANVPAASLTGTINSARLPTPTNSAIGGVKSIAGVSHQFVTSIDNTGQPALAQPVIGDISGAGTAAAKNTGTTVFDPGTGSLEFALPYQTITGNGHTYVAADLGKDTRRTNAGLAMADTLPSTSTLGLVNGTRLPLTNADASAAITVTPGSGTILGAGDNGVIDPGRTIVFVYDLANTTWRRSQNTGNSALWDSTGALTVGNLPSISTVNGKMTDSGTPLANVALGAASSASGNLSAFANTGGKQLSDSGISTANLARTNAAQTWSAVQTYNAGNLKLAGSGGTHQVLQQSSSGAAVTVGQIATTDLSNAGPYASATLGQLPAIATNTAASAGNIDENQSVTVSFGAVTLTNGAPTNVGSLSLPAGAWRCYLSLAFSGSATATIQYFYASLSATSATLDATLGHVGTSTAGGSTSFAQLGTIYVNTATPAYLVASTTPIYAVAQAGFAVVTTITAGGKIDCWRTH